MKMEMAENNRTWSVCGFLETHCDTRDGCQHAWMWTHEDDTHAAQRRQQNIQSETLPYCFNPIFAATLQVSVRGPSSSSSSSSSLPPPSLHTKEQPPSSNGSAPSSYRARAITAPDSNAPSLTTSASTACSLCARLFSSLSFVSYDPPPPPPPAASLCFTLRPALPPHLSVCANGSSSAL